MPQPAKTRNAIVQGLLEHGNLSAAEITEVLGLTRRVVDASLIGARKTYGTKFFRISAWRRQLGTGGREIPVYALGPGRDTRRPTLGAEAHKEVKQRYVDANRAAINVRNRIRRGRTTGLNPFAQLMAPSRRAASTGDAL